MDGPIEAMARAIMVEVIRDDPRLQSLPPEAFASIVQEMDLEPEALRMARAAWELAIERLAEADDAPEILGFLSSQRSAILGDDPPLSDEALGELLRA